MATATLRPARTLFAPQTICSRFDAVRGHLAQRQLLRIRMAPRLQHFADHDAGERRRHGRDRFHLEAGQRELLGELRGRRRAARTP